MRARLKLWWYEVKNSLWFLPAVLTAAAMLLSVLTVQIDQTLLLNRRAGVHWLFSGGTDGARGVLQAIAGTMITVTALVFSITVVALQLAASQLTPRVLRAFMADRANQMALGFFISTFTYSLLVLRVVRSPLEDAGAFVPSLSVTVAIVLALFSVALLIYFVHHAANAMRASVVIDRAASVALELIAHRYPENVGEGVEPESPAWLATVPAAMVCTDSSGYLQSINADALFALAERHALTIRLEPAIGDFILPGAEVASVWPETARDEEVGQAIRTALVLGPERTQQADVAFGFQQLSDIAVKALSPGINDPTTAAICIDRLSEGLVTLANRGKPNEVRSGEDDSVRVVLPGPNFARLVGIAFDPIRHYGAGDPTIAEHLVSTLGRIARLIPIAHRAPIASQANLVLKSMRAQVLLPEDQEKVERAGAWIGAPAASADCEDAHVPLMP